MRIIAVAAVVGASSCVTLYGGAVHRVAVTSTPPGAQVFVDGEHAGATPARVTVNSGDPDLVITVEKDGYPPYSRRLQRSRSVGRIVASIATGAGLGFTSLAINRQLDDYNPLSSAIGFFWPLIDSQSGALFKFPDRVDARFDSPDLGQPWSPERRRQERERWLREPRGLRGSLNLNCLPAAWRSAEWKDSDDQRKASPGVADRRFVDCQRRRILRGAGPARE